jgi:hypothetical protein
MTCFDDIPNETVYLILSHLDLRRDLAAFCLVSRNCRTLAFSDLHRTLYLGLASHIEQIVLRISTEYEQPPLPISLRISPCVRCLVFDDERYASKYDREQLICDDIVSRFTNIIHHFTGLESVAWRSHWLPRNTQMFKTLRTHCPRLCSVELLNYYHELSQEKRGFILLCHFCF